MLDTTPTIKVVREGSRLGYKIINADQFDPSIHTRFDEGAPAKVEDVAPKVNEDKADERTTLRAQYLEMFGKQPFNGWSTNQLRAKIAEAGGN